NALRVVARAGAAPGGIVENRQHAWTRVESARQTRQDVLGLSLVAEKRPDSRPDTGRHTQPGELAEDVFADAVVIGATHRMRALRDGADGRHGAPGGKLSERSTGGERIGRGEGKKPDGGP